MCKYCEEECSLLDFESLDSWILGWTAEAKITQETAVYSTISVLLDRGYLRLVDYNDRACLDHGQKLRLNFCPFCGKRFCDCPLLEEDNHEN